MYLVVGWWWEDWLIGEEKRLCFQWKCQFTVLMTNNENDYYWFQLSHNIHNLSLFCMHKYTYTCTHANTHIHTLIAEQSQGCWERKGWSWGSKEWGWTLSLSTERNGLQAAHTLPEIHVRKYVAGTMYNLLIDLRSVQERERERERERVKESESEWVSGGTGYTLIVTVDCIATDIQDLFIEVRSINMVLCCETLSV